MILRDTLFQADIAIHWGLMHGFSTHGSYITEVPVEMHHLLCSPRFEFQHSVKPRIFFALSVRLKLYPVTRLAPGQFRAVSKMIQGFPSCIPVLSLHSLPCKDH